jgi:hypothetical protein
MMLFGRPDPSSLLGEFMLWTRTNMLAVFLMRILQLIRIVGWIVYGIVSFFTTLITGVLYPLSQRVWVFVWAFVHFYWALLLGTVVIEVAVFWPFFMSVITYLLWLFWPTLSCLLEEGWPAARLGLDLVVNSAAMAAQVLNLGIRTFNMCVPVIGFLINFLAEITVQWSKYVTLLLGENNIDDLATGIREIMMQLTEIWVNCMEAMVAISPSVLQAFSVQAGITLSIYMEAASIILEVTAWVFRIMPFQVIPFSRFIGPAIRLLKVAYGLRGLLVVAAAGVGSSMSSRSGGSGGDAHDREIWSIIGESAEHYWDSQSADRGAAQLEHIGQWLMEHPLGTYTDYYLGSGIGLNNLGYYAGSAPRQRATRGAVPADEALPPNWQHQSATPEAEDRRKAGRPFYYTEGPATENPLHFLNASARHAHYYGHTRLSDEPLDSEFGERRQCKSKRCGGAGASVQHPLKTIGEERMRDMTPLHNMVPDDIRSHRRRYANMAALLHATRKTAVFSAKHNDAHGHHLGRHTANLVRYATGEETLGAGVNAVLARHHNPMDSVMATMPVLSEFPPFKWILNMHPPEDQEAFYGVWASKRQFFLLNTTDEVTGEHHMTLHVTVARREDSPTTAAIREYRRQMAAAAPDKSSDSSGGGRRLSKRQFAAPGTMIPNTQPAPEDDVPPPPVTYVNPYEGVEADFFGPPQLQILGAAGIGVAGLMGLYAAGRLIEPALPILRMLYTRDCVSFPRHPWCLPEIPAQLICAATTLVNYVPRDLPVRLCKYETECGAIGFCIPDRPPLLQATSFVRSLRYQFNACWLQNIAVYGTTLVGMLFLTVRTGLDLASKLVPVIGPYVFVPLRDIVPEPISLQQSVCLVVFSYAGWSAVWLITGVLVILPLIIWAFTTAQAFLAMIEVVRGMEMEYYMYAMMTPGFELRQAMEDDVEARRAKNDYQLGHTYNALLRPTEDAIDAEQGLVGAEIGARAEEHVPHDERKALLKGITDSMHRCISLVGAPVQGRRALADLQMFENLWGAFVLPPHYSVEWTRLFMNAAKHSADKKANRTVPFTTGRSTYTVRKST